MRSDKKNLIVEMSFNFALSSIDYVDKLEKMGKKVIPLQLLKSSTSIGANIREAQNAESKRDFIHKFKIAAKEVDETIYWLELCEASQHYPSPKDLTEKSKSIMRVISKIIATSKSSSNYKITKSPN